LPVRAISAFFVEESTFFVTVGATAPVSPVQGTTDPHAAAGPSHGNRRSELPPARPEFTAAHLELASG
jgi:hypothetical protein